MKVKILGVPYTVEIKDREEDPRLATRDGYIDKHAKSIVVAKFVLDEDTTDNIESYADQVARHEIIHAYLYESGLDCESLWAINEEMIDWISIQLPKMIKTMEKIECL